MGPKKVKTNVKTKAKREAESTSTSTKDFDQIRLHTLPNAQKFENLVKSVWDERLINLDDLDHFVKKNLESRSWLPLYFGFEFPLVALIREFYSNLSIHSTSSSGHFLTTWIQDEEFQITKKIVSNTLLCVSCSASYLSIHRVSSIR